MKIGQGWVAAVAKNISLLKFQKSEKKRLDEFYPRPHSEREKDNWLTMDELATISLKVLVTKIPQDNYPELVAVLKKYEDYKDLCKACQAAIIA